MEKRREREDHFGFRIVKLSCCDLSVVPPRADQLSVAEKTKGIRKKSNFLLLHAPCSMLYALC
jgi:hypothetical protein